MGRAAAPTAPRTNDWVGIQPTGGHPLVGSCFVDAVIIGGGHNALVAATYLARAGLAVEILEAADHVGGAAVSEAPFPGVHVRLSRYAYLVSLMPPALIADLGLSLELADRSVASCTPYDGGAGPGALTVTDDLEATRASFRALTGSDAEHGAWTRFYEDAQALADALSPTLLGPLPTAAAIRDAVPVGVWRDLVARPLGEALEQRFTNDLVRGVVATDALIGTFASLREDSLVQNRCFLYHVLGGPWRVPVGGMGSVSGELRRVSVEAGVRISTGHRVDAVEPGPDVVLVRGAGPDGAPFVREAAWALSGVAPAALAELCGAAAPSRPVGAQLKINMVLSRLPELRSGVDPAVAFAGTLHSGEGYRDLERVHGAVAAGEQIGSLSGPPPGEVYCHTLSDRSILSPELAAAGVQTLTYFGLHVRADDPTPRDELVRAAIAGLERHLAEPLGPLLLTDADDRPCLEAKVPLDIEAELGMPGGHLFHGDLAWPWLPDAVEPSGPAERWGVATPFPRVLVCGSGAVRGGAVSGIAGHNAAHALLELRG